MPLFCTSHLLNFGFWMITCERKVRCMVCLFDISYWSYYSIHVITIFELTKVSLASGDPLPTAIYYHFYFIVFFLRKNGISYINPHVSGYNQRLIPIQVAAREKCRILLYVITHRTRSLSSMIEVSRGCQGEM